MVLPARGAPIRDIHLGTARTRRLPRRLASRGHSSGKSGEVLSPRFPSEMPPPAPFSS